MNWKVIPGFESYEVSEEGQIKRAKPGSGARVGRVVTPYIDKIGRHRYKLADKNNQKKDLMGHRLVALAFLGPAPEEKPYVCHKNGNPGDNRLENLYWGSQKENMADSKRHGTFCIGVNQKQAKLDDEKVRRIKELRTKGLSHQKIADTIGNVSFTAVRQVLEGITWKHVQ